MWQDTWWSYSFSEADHVLLSDINGKELFAVVTQCATFGPQLKGKTILLFCDNSASVDAISKLQAKSPVLTKFVRELFYLCAHYSFQVVARHVPGVGNYVSDRLSRPAIRQEAWQLQPSLARQPIAPVLPSLSW